MQFRSAQSQAEAACKRGSDTSFAIAVVEADAQKADSVSAIEVDAELFHCRKRVWHQTFAASFVDWGTIMIGDGHSHTRFHGENGCGKPRRTSAHNKEIGTKFATQLAG